MDTDLKEKHIAEAGRTIVWLDGIREDIWNPQVRMDLEKLCDRLRSLRDTEYYFESGEKDVDRLYTRYLPYLHEILKEYLQLQETHDFEKVQKMTVRLREMLRRLSAVINDIEKSLPEDEIMDAQAEADGKKRLNQLQTGSKKGNGH